MTIQSIAATADNYHLQANAPARHTPSAQLQGIGQSVKRVAIAATALLALVVALGASLGVPLDRLVRDPLAVTGTPAYVGILSNLGIVLWAAAATVCLFAYSLLRTWATDRQLGRFLLCSALLTCLLGLDDLFMLHDEVVPAFGIHEKIVLLAYGALALVYLARFRLVILRTDYLLAALAAIFFAASLFVDSVPGALIRFSDLIGEPAIRQSVKGVMDFNHASTVRDAEFLLEDGAKFIGILFWLSYLARVSTQALRGALARSPASKSV